MERVKNLVLIGKIPMDKAPPEMAKHPVMLIEKYCNKVIAEKRAKVSFLMYSTLMKHKIFSESKSYIAQEMYKFNL